MSASIDDGSAGDHKRAVRSLRREWAIYFGFGIGFLALAFFTLYTAWDSRYAWRWLAVAAALVAYIFIFVWRNLEQNRLKEQDADVLPSFGLANGITIIRSVFNAGLAGFLVIPWPGGWLAWAPSMLYLVSCLMDYADGFAARVTRRTTYLGEAMDMKWDGTGMVSGVVLSVLYGQTPLAFLLVGLARPLFLLGEWQRRRRGLTIYPLPFSWVSRTLAGVMMGFISVILMPVFDPPPTQVAAVLFMLPFLANFLRDWLVVSGRMQARPVASPAAPSRLGRAYRHFLPLTLRAALVLLLASLIAYQARLPVPSLGILLVAALAIPLILLGVAGRVVALAVLLMSGFGFQAAPLEWRYWLILLVSTALFLSGTGRYSLWKPEEWLIYHRAGERRSANEHR